MKNVKKKKLEHYKRSESRVSQGSLTFEDVGMKRRFSKTRSVSRSGLKVKEKLDRRNYNILEG